MALTVPTVDGPSVAQTALPGAYQTAPDVGGAGRALGQQLALAGNAVRAFDEYRQRQDIDAASNAEAKLKLDYVEQKRLTLQRAGSDAWGATDDTKRWLDDAAKRHSADLTPEQQKLFRRSVDALRLSAIAVAGAHEDEQRKVATVDSVQARISADTQIAASSPTPLEVDNARQSIHAGIERLSRLGGWAPEKTAYEKQRQLGTLHVQVLQTLVERDPLNAQAYFDANRDEIPGTGHAELERVIRIGTTKLQAQAFADEAIAEKIPEAEALAMIRKKYSGDHEDTLATVLKARYAEVNALRERAQNQAAETAWGVVDRGGGWNSIPTTVQAALDPRTSIAIKNHLKEKANSQGIDRTKTDWSLYAQLRDQAVEDPEGFAKSNLVQYFDRLAPAQREQLIDIRSSIAKPSKTKESTSTLTQQMNATLQAVGIKSEKARGQFLSFVMTEVDDAAKEKGKPLTFDERQAIIDRALLKGPDPDAWGITPGFMVSDKRMFQLNPEQRQRFKPNETTRAPVAISTDADYEALPPGTRFVTPDGKTGTKR